MWLKQERKWENSRKEGREGRAWRGGQESRKWEAAVIACYNIFAFVLGRMEKDWSVLSRGMTWSDYHVTRLPWIILALLKRKLRGQG